MKYDALSGSASCFIELGLRIFPGVELVASENSGPGNFDALISRIQAYISAGGAYRALRHTAATCIYMLLPHFLGDQNIAHPPTVRRKDSVGCCHDDSKEVFLISFL